MKHTKTQKARRIAAITAASLCALTGVAFGAPPASIAKQYNKSPNWNTSDEFNGKKLDTKKWTYRTRNSNVNWATNSSGVYFTNEKGTKFLTLKGKWSSNKKKRIGAGIASKHQAYFGFYELRWRVNGIPSTKRSPWHPAVWYTSSNFGKNFKSINRKKYPNILEIDFMEMIDRPAWRSQTITWPEGATKYGPVANLRPNLNDYPQGKWQTHGLEYHPNYIQFWAKKGGKWKAGKRVWYSGNQNNSNRIGRKFVTPGFWILSNLDNYAVAKRDNPGAWKNANSRTHSLNDSWTHIDYFRHYKRK